MNLKRLLITLISLSFILAVNTSCENDRDREETEPTLDVSALSNTYKEKRLILNMQEADKETSVVVTAVDAENVTFKLVGLVTDRPEVIFTTKLTQKEGGTFSFDQKEHEIAGDGGFSYFFKGSFVGNAEVGTTIVAEYTELVHMKENDIFTFKGTVGFAGEYCQEHFVVNGVPAITGLSTTGMRAKFDEKNKRITLYNLFFNSGDITFDNIQLVRSQEEPNTFTFLSDEVKPIIKNDDNNFRKITIIKGVVVNDVVYIEASIVSKSEFVGTKWQINPLDNEYFNITIKSRLAADQPKDDERIAFLKKHHKVVSSLLIRLNTIKFNADLTADVSYRTNSTGVVNTITTPAGGAFSFTSATGLGLGISEVAMQEVAEQCSYRVTLGDISSMFFTSNNKYRYSSTNWKSSTSADVQLFELPLTALRSAVTFAITSMPTTETGMKEMGLTMSQEDINKLKEIFTHMIGVDTSGFITKHNLSNGSITVGAKKIK